MKHRSPTTADATMDPGLRDAVARVRLAVGPLASAEAEDLRRAVSAEENRWTAPARQALATLQTRDDEDRIVATLLLLRMELPPPLQGALAFEAARTLYRLSAYGLYPVRADLLELVVRLRPPPDLLAETLVALANTRNVLLPSLNDRRSSRDLLNRAISAAETAGRVDIRADAVTAWVRTSLLGLLDDLDSGEGERSEALVRLDRLLEGPLDNLRRADALWAKGKVLLHPGPRHDKGDAEGAVAALGAAVQLMPPDAWRADAERDLSLALSRLGRRSDALAIARRLLPGPHAGPSGRGLAHAHLARLLAEDGEAEAEQQFTEALRQLGPDHDRLLVLLQLAEFLLSKGRRGEACGHLVRVAEERDHLRALDRLLLDRLSVQAGLRVSDTAASSAVGTAFEGLERGERATRDRDPEAFWSVFLDFVNGRWPTNPEIDRQMAHLAGRWVDHLPGALEPDVLGWAAKAGQTWLHARLLERSGDRSGAREVLERAIPSCATSVDRLNLRMLLLAVLPREPTLLRPVIEALESEALEIHPEMLHDLAVACRLAAGGAREWHTRSLRYAEAAWCGLDGELRDKAHQAWLGALSDAVRITLPVSDPWLAPFCFAFASSLEAENSAPAMPIVAMLVACGPLMHPDLLPAVESMLERTADPRARELAARVAAIRELQAGGQIPQPPLRGNDERHCDPWLVELVAGRPVGEPPEAVVRDVKQVVGAMAVRPDRADAVLAAILPAGMRLPADLRSTWVEVMEGTVKAGEQGDGAWTALSQALTGLALGAPPRVARAVRLARRDPSAPSAALDELHDAAHSSAERRVRARAAMQVARHTVDADEARRHKELAVHELTRLAAEEPGPEVTLSLGNAWRLPPDPDFARAIECYSECFASGPTEPESLGTLHKVWADALRESGSDAAMREAQQHIDIALVYRASGWLRAEALWSAAEIADRHPDHDEQTRCRRAAERYAESVRVDPAASAHVLSRLLELLARWRPTSRDAAVRTAVLEDLVGRYPNQKGDIERARIGGLDGPLPGTARMSAAEQGQAFELYRDPEFQMVLAARTAIDQGGADALPRVLQVAQGQDGVGACVARALLLAALVRHARSDESAARTATDQARAALTASTSPPLVTAYLLHQLGDGWAPRDHVADPLRDFGRSVELHRCAVSILGGVEHTPRDIVVGLARSLRYAPTDDARSAGHEVRALLERAITQDRSANNAWALANDLTLLADLELHVGDGESIARHRRAESIQREALTHAVDDDTRGLCAGNLAWTLTVQAQHERGEAALRLIDEALGHYDDAERWLTNPSGHVTNNRCVCLDLRAQLLGRPDESVALWEARVVAGGHSPDRLAQVRHNLAEALVRRHRGDDSTRAIALYREALAARPVTRVPRYHYESALALALALLDRRPDGWQAEALDTARSAIAAGRSLGVGTELAVAATVLVEVALHAEVAQEIRVLAEEAWSVRRESAAALLLDARCRTEEANAAIRVAFRLAELALRDGFISQVRSGWLLDEASSETILRWLLRADAPAHRLLAARLRVPDGAPVGQVEWQRALALRDVSTVERMVRDIRSAHPTWLLDDPSLADTQRWLAGGGSVGIGVWPGQTSVLVAVVRSNGGSRVLVLPGEPPKMDAELTTALRDRAQRVRLLGSLTAWADRQLAPLRAFLDQPPDRVLWCPHGVLTLVPPSRVFPGVAVSVSKSLALRSPVKSRRRPASSVVVVADPGGDRGLGTAAIEGADRLSGRLDSCRVVVGVGPNHGPSLLPRAVDLHPTVRHTIQELDSAAFAVVLAHGATEGPDEAWIELLNEDGGPERLDVGALARDPGAVSELSVVLLSCETGRAADHADVPGGVAGTLLLAGAREVVAPLWEVGLHSALNVADALCRARSAGTDLSVALATVAKQSLPQGGPALGRPSPVDREAASWDAAAFVRWVG